MSEPREGPTNKPEETAEANGPFSGWRFVEARKRVNPTTSTAYERMVVDLIVSVALKAKPSAS